MKAAGDFDVAVIDEAAQALEAIARLPTFPEFTWAELSAGHVVEFEE